ncbi:hypothetical protein ACI2KR_27450 [Pseudomonas luteola]
MLLMSHDIDEAESILTEEGVPFGETRAGSSVIEAARELYELQYSASNKPAVPIDEFIERREDMGTGRLRLIRQEDGDMCVSIIDSEGYMAGIEFCTYGAGGGRSRKVLAALYDLARAIEEENNENPLPL